jgi:diguanylate cyclase (GGDEF)-like protein
MRLTCNAARRPRQAWRSSRLALIVALGWMVFGTVVSPRAVALTPMRFVHIGVDDGLSQGSVDAIVQDAQGFVWLGTQDGLDRYDGYSFTYISRQPTDRGALPRDFVTAIAEDKSGTLWIGTNGGGLASRQAATGLVTRKVEVGGVPVVADTEHIQVIYVDREDRVWIGTADHGLVMADPANGTVRRLRHDASASSSLSSDSVYSVLEDRLGRMWIGTSTGLDLADPLTNKVKRYAIDTSRYEPASGDDTAVRALLEGADGALWVGSRHGLLRFDSPAAEPVIYRHVPGDDSSLPSNNVNALLKDDSQRIWIGTADGLALWNPGTDRFSNYRHDAGIPTSLPGNEIDALYQDRGGVIWIGTESDGAARWNPRSWSFGHRQVGALRGQGVANITGFAEDNHNTLWVATLDDGLRALDADNGAAKVYRRIEGNPDSLRNDRINSICTGPDGTLWLATRSLLSRFDPRTGEFEHFLVTADRDSQAIRSDTDEVRADSHGHVWLATDGGGLGRFDVTTRTFKVYRNDPSDPQSLPDDHVHAVAEDRTGKLWVGMDDGELALLDPNTDHFYRYSALQVEASDLSGASVYAIHVDDHGTVWLGTHGAGLIEVIGSANVPATIRFRVFGASEGLENSIVYAIESDSEGQLWVSTNRGLAQFNPVSRRFRTFHRSHGLQGEEFNLGASYRRRDGQLLFGGPNGYNTFDPRKLELNEHEPQIALTGYYKLNSPVNTGLPVERLRHAQLGYRDSVVSFEFAALDFSSPENNRFSYMLEGFDKTWVDAGNKHAATYTNLAGRDYVFRVRAANGDGKWNSQGIALPISVESPPWATASAKLLYAILFIMMLWAVRHLQQAKIRREVQYSNRLKGDVEARTAELARANVQLREASLTDQLTGLGNRRQLGEAMAALQRSTGDAAGRGIGLLVIDLDHLKPINDTYGHEAGDRVILQIAALLRQCCRASDYLVRWGGDEFVIGYLDADFDAVAGLAEKVRSRISKQIFRLADGKAARCTCSVGFCAYPFVRSAPDLLTWEQTLAIADAGLNYAKKLRNHWVGIASTERSGMLDAKLIDALNIDPEETERGGYITLRVPPFRPEDTGVHERVTGRRNRD